MSNQMGTGLFWRVFAKINLSPFGKREYRDIITA